MIKHVQSISFPQSKKTDEKQIEQWTTAKTIESLIKDEEMDKKSEQLTQIEANFELSKVRIHNK
jgi:hypothetical protein